MSLSFSKFCEELGFPLTTMYSWCAISRERQQAIFTVWDDQIDHANNAYEFWNDKTDNVRLANPDGRKVKNPKEMNQVLLEALEGNFQVFGISCTPVDPLASPRAKKSYFEKELLVIQLRQTETGIIGKFQGTVDANFLRSGLSVPQSMGLSAIDDLDAEIVGSTNPGRALALSTYYIRDDKVRQTVIRRAKGKCEYCGTLGFKKSDGTSYIEAHHIISLAKQGPDTLANVIALCPNHHREAHFGRGREQLEMEFKTKLAKLRGN